MATSRVVHGLSSRGRIVRVLCGDPKAELASPVWSQVSCAACLDLRGQGNTTSSLAVLDRLHEARRLPCAPYRSRTEERYGAMLAAQQQAGLLTQWWYEPMRLALAPRTTLTPDFLLQWSGGPETPLTFDEVKGWRREDAMVKLKVAARLYPIFRFRWVEWTQGAWIYHEVPPV